MTEASSPDILDRLFIALVRSVRRHQPERLAAGMDVAELVRFVPYKAVRHDIGADTDDDYGHAMTRLLAGDGGYVFADELMQDDLRAELASNNPNLQAYRSYLNAKISLAQERVRATLDALGPAPTTDAADAPPAVAPIVAPTVAPTATAASARTAAKGAGAVPAAKSPSRAAIPEPRSQPRAPVLEPTSQPRVPKPITPKPRPLPDPTASVAADIGARLARPGCRYCGQPLPQGRDVRFCPHCGQDLAVRRCGACSAELEPGWKFCVACGRATTP